MDMNPTDAIILIVEDDDDLRETIEYELRRHKLNVMSAVNGAEALQIASANKVHLVLSDVKMPGGDGIGLLKTLREIDSCRPLFFFISGLSDLSVEDAMAMGAQKFFLKPFDRAQIVEEVFNCLIPMSESV